MDAICKDLAMSELAFQPHTEENVGKAIQEELVQHGLEDEPNAKNYENASCSWDTYSSGRSYSSSTTHLYLELEPLQRAEDFSDQESNEMEELKELKRAMEQPEILTLCEVSEKTEKECTERNNTIYNAFASQQDSSSLLHHGGSQACHGKKKSLSRTSSFNQMERFVTRKMSYPCYSSSTVSWGSNIIFKSKDVHTCGDVSTGKNAVGSQMRRTHPFAHQSRNEPQTRSQQTKEQISFKISSDELGNRKLGSWWKQALDTGRRPSAGLLPVFERISNSSQVLRYEDTKCPGCGSVNMFHCQFVRLINPFVGMESMQSLEQVKRTQKTNNIFQQCSSRMSCERSREEDSVLKRGADRIIVSRTEKQTGQQCFSRRQGKPI